MSEGQTAKKEDFMKKISKHKANGRSEEMLPHYDFSEGVKGKHFKKFREGVSIQLLGETKDTKLVVLDEDMGKLFPDSKSVNNALRHIVDAMPKVKRKRAA